MIRMPVAAALVLALAAPARGGVEVTAAGGRLDVRAAGAPVSEVLDGLARKTKMKVVYEGATPRALVSVDFAGRTPVEAVLGVLEGTGLDYALILNDAGTEVETLMIVGPGAPSAATRAAAPRGGALQPDAQPDAPPDDVALDEQTPDEAEVVRQPRPGAHVVPEPPETAGPKFGPVNPPAVTFPSSPFAPGAPKPQPPPSPAPSPATNR
jgi:hypothetical protein